MECLQYGTLVPERDFPKLGTLRSLLHISIDHVSGSGGLQRSSLSDDVDGAPPKMIPWPTAATQAGVRGTVERVSLRASISCMLCPRQRQPLASCSWNNCVSSCDQWEADAGAVEACMCRKPSITRFRQGCVHPPRLPLSATKAP